jgi:deoxyribodipyrimidine photolyase
MVVAEDEKSRTYHAGAPPSDAQENVAAEKRADVAIGIRREYDESRRLLSVVTKPRKGDASGGRTQTLDTSSMLSPYLKFGCVSIREVYHHAMQSKVTSAFTRCVHYGLWMGEYFKNLGWYYPTLFGWDAKGLPVPPTDPFILYEKDKDKEFLETIHSREFFNDVHWVRDFNGQNRLKYSLTWCPSVQLGVNFFQLLCVGRTGFTFVDAAMRQLDEVGFCPYRARLIAANFLVRLLGLNWQDGQRYFACKQLDYDWTINDCNWHWVASMAMYAPRYSLHIYDPYEQSATYDPQGMYIRRWLPALTHVETEHLHFWEYFHKYYNVEQLGYVKPCLNVAWAKLRSLAMYEAARKRSGNQAVALS